jgi:hypothetical protein
MFDDYGENTERSGQSPRHPLFEIGVAMSVLLALALMLTAHFLALLPKFD